MTGGEVAAVAALATLTAEIIRLMREGLMPPACADALCRAHPELRPLLPRLPLSEYRDARTASMVARGSSPAAEIAATRERIGKGPIALVHAEGMPVDGAKDAADYQQEIDDGDTDDGGGGAAA